MKNGMSLSINCSRPITIRSINGTTWTLDVGDLAHIVRDLGNLAFLLGDLALQLSIEDPQTLDLLQDDLVVLVQVAGLGIEFVNLRLGLLRLLVDPVGGGIDVR